jgi:hypothetical protein
MAARELPRVVGVADRTPNGLSAVEITVVTPSHHVAKPGLEMLDYSRTLV